MKEHKGFVLKIAGWSEVLPDGKTAGREAHLPQGAVAGGYPRKRKIIIVKQYRKAIEAVSYEIPAGKLGDW